MKPRILIVDDDEAITRQLLWILTDDYDVVTANNMQTAIRHATIYEPAVSIVDLHLPPAVNTPDIGLRVMEYIKAHLPKSKVLVMTEISGVLEQKACYSIGADAFLAKPFETELLLTTMRRMAPLPLDLA